MAKSKSKPATVKVDEEVHIVRVDKINAKIHDLNIESVKEVERLQALIQDYQDIVRTMYLSEPMQNWMTGPDLFKNHVSKAKIKAFFKAMEQGRME